MSNDYVPENATVLRPFVQTPLNDRFAMPMSRQGTPCGFFESQFYRCMEAYGVQLGRHYCDLEHRDFTECVRRTKQIQRNKAIRQERMKQFVQGKIDRPFLENHPQADGHDPDYFKHNIVR